jgi:hypothetical protein
MAGIGVKKTEKVFLRLRKPQIGRIELGTRAACGQAEGGGLGA